MPTVDQIIQDEIERHTIQARLLSKNSDNTVGMDSRYYDLEATKHYVAAAALERVQIMTRNQGKLASHKEPLVGI